MIRLSDKIMNTDVCSFPPGFVPSYEDWLPVFDSIIGALSGATKFVVDNVTDYVAMRSGKDEWKMSDFPKLAPPFESMWVETVCPPHVVRRNGDIQKWWNGWPSMWGALIFASEGPCDDAVPEPIIKAMKNGYMEKVLSPDEPNGNDPKWTITAFYIGLVKGNVTCPHFWQMLRVDAHGAICDWFGQGILYSPKDVNEDEFRKMGFEIFEYLSVPINLAISMMHCKNVSHEEVQHSKQLSRAFLKKNGRPPFSHHVLNINPFKKMVESGSAAGTKLQKAMHICRGHFKDYTKSGLFGRIPGIFWWDAAMRSKNSDRMVLKDYKVTV